MIENKNKANRNLKNITRHNAISWHEQAKQRVANEKKKQNEKKRKAEVIGYNKKNLERELQNESRQQAIQRIANRQQTVCKTVCRVKCREEELR